MPMAYFGLVSSPKAHAVPPSSTLDRTLSRMAMLVLASLLAAPATAHPATRHRVRWLRAGLEGSLVPALIPVS